MKAYWINATEKTITEVDYSGYPDLKRMVGGYIQIAKMWPAGEVLFADEEGLLKGPTTWFRIVGHDNPIAGNAVVVGREKRDDSGDTEDPTFQLAALQAEVTFLAPEQVAAWARANSSEPAATFTDLDTGHTEVLGRVGELFGEAPKPKKGS
jgi:hypothetical protein